MRLARLLRETPQAAADLEITNLAYDTRAVAPGALFFCVAGFTRDGHDFAEEAIARGAVALAVERPLGTSVPEIRVRSTRAAMAAAAAAFYGDPTATLETVGITGTNGKTTTAFLARAMLQAAGRQTGMLGTVTSVIGGHERPVERTTPEAIDLQRTFRQMLDAGDEACVMEVSSHALELHRADAIHFAAAVFTNISRDHLDFHPTMEAYFAAKRRLFTELAPARAIVNIDDQHGEQLARDLGDPVTYAIDREADYRARAIATDLNGSRFVIVGLRGEHELRSPLRGRFNVYNALAAFATATTMGVPDAVAAEAIERAAQVPGRFETVEEGQPFAVIVDYAHTPDSLENVLRAARELSAGRVHVVFGCGGDRDRGKRPLMGKIASRLADRVILTSDNPRSEDPEAIIEEIAAGIPDGAAEREPDRRAAIARALETAEPGDVVVIAGKGHEQGQEFADGHKLPFDDVSAARELLTGAPTPR